MIEKTLIINILLRNGKLKIIFAGSVKKAWKKKA